MSHADFVSGAFATGLKQPNQQSCGAACLVMARMVLDESYAELVATGAHPVTGHALVGELTSRFSDEVLGMHRRVTRIVDVRGRLQVPWPRALGTPPWALARQLSAMGSAAHPPRPYVMRPAAPAGAAYDSVVAATGQGSPVGLYVGNRWLPRHVILALSPVEGGLRCYEPARGRLVDLSRDDFVGKSLGVAGWDVPWFVVRPA